MLSDFKYALRQLGKAPAFTLTVVLTLAVGIGANLTAFAIARAIFWQPLPVADADRLVAVYSRAQEGTGFYTGVAYNEFTYFHDRADLFSAFAAYLRIPVHVRIGDATVSMIGELVTSKFFAVLPVRTVIGRPFRNLNDRAMGSAPEVVLSHTLWERTFNRDPGVLGTTLYVEGQACTIVGVAEPDFSGVLMDWQQPVQFWLPMNMVGATPFANLISNWKANSLMAVGRLNPGVRPGEANTAIATLNTRMSQDEPERLRAWGGKYDFKTVVLPIQEARFFPGFRDSVVASVQVVGAVMAMVLIIGCLNLASLTLARATARGREWAIRAALGSGQMRLVRQSIVETLLLGFAGAGLALVVASLAWWTLALYGRPFRVMLPTAFRIDAQTVLVSIGLSLLSAIAFGLWPVLRATRIDLNTTLKQGSLSGSIGGVRARSVLIAAQIAVSLVLLVGAGLFTQTVRNARAADRLGDLDRVTVVNIDARDPGGRLASELLQGVRALDIVNHAGYGSNVLWTQGGAGGRLVSRVTCDTQILPVAENLASPGYFDTLRIPVMRGRDFSERDDKGVPAVVIINETLSRRCWPEGEAVGKQLKVGSSAAEIVGVVQDTNTRGFRSLVEPTVYYSYFQNDHANTPGTMLVQTSLEHAALYSLLRDISRRLDPNIVITVETMREQIDRTMAQERLTEMLCLAMAGVALGLTVMGLYGVVTLLVTARTREIGVRIAVGATTKDVLRLVFNQTFLIILSGVLVGVAAALAISRTVSAMLYGVDPADPGSFLIAAFLLAVCGSLAALVPARRAARIDPLTALRHE